MNVIVVGPAASGKSTFVWKFLEYLRRKGYDAKAVNLDPATPPCYEAAVDVRTYVRTEDVMTEYGLGINGALLKSMEFAAKYVNELIISADFVLYDTPGQMEVFLYSKAGLDLLNEIPAFKAGVFLAAADVASTPENFVSVLAQCAVVSLRTALPTLTVFSKCDITKPPTIQDVKEKFAEGGMLAELMEKLLAFLECTTLPYRTIEVSATKGLGFDDVFSALNELFCSCGDLS
ncbi:MAG TPA: GTPase [Archaeoglobus veneficus]|nr:GTPase [Archaeoglobus veneficus]